MMEEANIAQQSGSSHSCPGSTLTPSRKPKKAVVTDNVSIITTGSDECNRRPYVDDEELLQLAMQDISKLFGLDVSIAADNHI